MSFLKECNSYKSSSLSMNHAYKFKVFKKTTKFKKYNRGLTRFIHNRKKNILRKKRSSLQFMSYIVNFWTKYYTALRNSTRFYQSLNILPYTSTLTSLAFTQKFYTKDLYQASTSIWGYNYNTASISKKFFFNKALFNRSTHIGLDKLFFAIRIGFIFTESSSVALLNATRLGLLSDSNHQYSSSLVGDNVKRRDIYTLFYKRLFLHNSAFILSLRKIIIITLLYNVKQ